MYSLAVVSSIKRIFYPKKNVNFWTKTANSWTSLVPDPRHDSWTQG